MADSATRARAAAIEGFAAVLSELRDSVGRPSFREMAGRSRAISHTTLHEAVKGNRLPSWGTTAEFVKVCGADPLDYREPWERADRAVGTAQSAARPVARTDHLVVRSEPLTVDVPMDRVSHVSEVSNQESAERVDATPAARAASARRRARYVVIAVAATAVLATGAAVASWLAGPDQPLTAQPPRAQYAAGDCPVQQKNPTPKPAEHEGDGVAFVGDVTFPDCTHVRPGQTFEKVWRLKNTGSMPWRGYGLQRIDIPQRRDQCQTIPEVLIPDTAPGQPVDAKVQVMVPTSPGFCFVRFKMIDANGKVAFPGTRPVNFQVIVD